MNSPITDKERTDYQLQWGGGYYEHWSAISNHPTQEEAVKEQRRQEAKNPNLIWQVVKITQEIVSPFTPLKQSSPTK